MKFLLALPLALSLAACGGDTKTDAAKTDATKSGDKTATKDGAAAKTDDKAAAGGPLDLPKLGLKADAPAGATVGDVIGGGTGHMIQAPGLVVSVEVASETRPKTGEDAQKEADMYSPKNAKVEKLADGWALTFDNEGGMGKNYFVNVRREIDGKSIWCETTAAEPAQQANALAFCKSLKK